jgi:DNA primase
LSRFTPETVERVKEAADIVEIVSAHTELRRGGERYTGLCPFHEERTPSFSVDAREKLYHCFGCGVGGDVIKFVEEKESLGFPEAVETLADRYGVEVERETQDPRTEEIRRRRARIAELLGRTTQFYEAYLWDSDEAGGARSYLESRGLGEEVLRAFGVGYAPSAWDQVLTRGQRAEFSVEELVSAGLIQKGRKGGYYDRFRARITFPVRDARGRVQGFGARALRPDSKPKYLNSPEGELYRKSRTLYGIDLARGPIAKSGRAVVVEGYTDVLAAHQAGIDQAVAVMGTAITPDQLSQLARYTEAVVLAMDADRSGRAAMLRAQRVAGSRKLDLRVAAMPAGEDPAEMLAAGGAEPISALISEAMPLAEFHVKSALDYADLDTPAGRDRALDEIAPVLAAMGESISRDELTRLVADHLDADPGLVARRVRDGSAPAAARQPREPPEHLAKELREDR